MTSPTRTCAPWPRASRPISASETRPVVVGHDSRYCAELFAREVARVLVANGLQRRPARSGDPDTGGVVGDHPAARGRWRRRDREPQLRGVQRHQVQARLRRLSAARDRRRDRAPYRGSARDGRHRDDLRRGRRHRQAAGRRSAPGLLRAARQDGRPRRAPRSRAARAPRGDVRRRAPASSLGRSAADRPPSRSCTASATRASAACTPSRSIATCPRRWSGCSRAASTSASPTTVTPIASASSTRPARYINQLQVMALFAMYLLEKRGLRGDIVRSVTTSGMLDAARRALRRHRARDAGRLQVHRHQDDGDRRHSGRRGIRRLRLPRPHPRA